MPSITVDVGDKVPQVVEKWMSQVVEPAREKLSQKGIFLPEPDICRKVLTAAYTDRGGPVRLRSTPAKRADDIERAFHYCRLWHTAGGGGLWSPMMWSFRIGRELYDKLDTLVLVLTGGRSTGGEAWERALGR